ncbi:MAG: hypothetical protein C0613_12455 [Desulfobulbaceae bacterium]|nr:MAG: hypothetical protein C0613_12455 [Desulfobulbaceae bacterium]
MIKKCKAFSVGAGLALAVSACSGSGPELQEGMWEITTEVNMPGMPMQIPAMVHRQCLGPDDVVPRQGPAQQEICDYSKARIRGNTVSWTVECTSPGGTTTTVGEITYRGTTFDGSLQVAMSGAVEMSGTNHISGRRVGDCQ